MGIFDGVLLCSDIDGTLTDHGKVPDINRRYLSYFMEQGGMFTVSTGRLPYYLKEANLLVTPNVPMVCSNGTVIYDLEKERVIYEATLSEVLVKEVLLFAREIQPDAKVSLYHAKGIIPGEEINADVSVNKMVFALLTEEDAVILAKKIQSRFPKCVRTERSWQVGTEVIPAHAGKGVCVKKLKELCGAKQLICVGDYENDISMLEAADISYAVENALDAVKAVADRITVANTEGAIAEVIKMTEQELRS